MTVDELREQTHTAAQATVIIEKASQLGCWPDDVLIESDPFEYPAGHVLAVMGHRKGKAHVLGVSPEGGVST